MRRALAAALIGLASGIAGTVFLLHGEAPSSGDGLAPVRNLDDVPKMTTTAAGDHRRSRYQDLRTVEQVLALPSEFAQTEALYVIAGRSDSATVQGLIFEANRIRDPLARRANLEILFARLTELDPRSAVALAGNDAFENNAALTAAAWRTWARLDLDAALAAANADPNPGSKRRVAQALFAAFGYLGNDTTDRIEAELGIGPDDTTRARYLYGLADRSIAQAIAYIESRRSPRERQELAGWLARHVARSDTDNALGVTALFTDEQTREAYERLATWHVVAVRPVDALEEALAQPPSQERESRIASALRELAKTDIDTAIAYFERLGSVGTRQGYSRLIAEELAHADPDRALEWAQSADPGGQRHLVSTVLSTIARSDADLALSQASRIRQADVRDQSIAMILHTIARQDPARAAAHVTAIEGRDYRVSAATQIAMAWAKTDPAAAVDWLHSSDDVDGRSALDRAMFMARHDVDTAMRMLPHLDGEVAERWRAQVAQQLGRERPRAAVDFLRGFEGTSEYDELQAAVAGGLATHDIDAARRMVDRLAPGPGRDRAMTRLIQAHAQHDPASAIAWLGTIADEERRNEATAVLAGRWLARDPEAAERWAAGLQAGAQRDHAVSTLAGQWHESTPARQRTIASIEDDQTRSRAWMQHLFAISRYDPDGARRLLPDADLTEFDRRRVGQLLDRRDR